MNERGTPDPYTWLPSQEQWCQGEEPPQLLAVKRIPGLLPHCIQGSKICYQQLYWSHPRKFGQGSPFCHVCSNQLGLIQKYGFSMCHQYFYQYAKDIGFIKLD
ncbi:40S ribosomal protein S29-like [Rhinolophus ferrumequinum]|uniref:40S ribosomal protein S29-like n=1 Tax=Rhinolophus ferrumequinum TaxID=59479 RepID=UPI00140FE049|nr:40S ribosomal protein S29-like [Rhinolophus ferrumequinum]